MNKKALYILILVFAAIFVFFNLMLKTQPDFMPASPLAPKNSQNPWARH